MQDIATKVEGSQLTAEEFNQIPSEIENVITSTGQSLTNTDVRQLVKAISIYTGKGDFYNTSGTANNIILNPIDNMQTPIAYNDGLRVRFIASATNTNSVTINILGLTSCELLNATGSSLAAGELVINKEYSATYLDGKFRLFASDTSKVNLNLGNSTAITNCIIEIPQDIKCEIVDGVFTVYQGTSAYYPNGAGVFSKFTLQTNRTFPEAITNIARKMVIALNPANGTLLTRGLEESVSGTGVTTVAGFAYDTTINKIGYYSTTGVLQADVCTFPIAIVSTNSSGVITSIDQVFNGFGYIGSTVYALPGVKGLIPNGRNEDGSLRNVEFTVDRVMTRSITDTNTRDNLTVGFSPFRGSVFGFSVNCYYDKDTNFNIADNAAFQFMLLGSIGYRDTKITSFTPKLPFHAVDYNDFNKLDEEVVKTSGNQTISGNKTFVNDVYRDGVLSGGGTNAIVTRDTNNKGSTRFTSYYASSGIYNRMQANNTTSGKHAYIDVVAKDDGTSIFQTGGNSSIAVNLLNASEVLLPTVVSNEESNKGATTKFVRDWLAGGNNVSGDRYIYIPVKGQATGSERFKIQWGHIEKGVTTITFPTPFSSTANITVCPVAYYNSASQVAFYDITTTGCKVYPNRSDYAIKWLAIGY